MFRDSSRYQRSRGGARFRSNYRGRSNSRFQRPRSNKFHGNSSYDDVNQWNDRNFDESKSNYRGNSRYQRSSSYKFQRSSYDKNENKSNYRDNSRFERTKSDKFQRNSGYDDVNQGNDGDNSLREDDSRPNSKGNSRFQRSRSNTNYHEKSGYDDHSQWDGDGNENAYYLDEDTKNYFVRVQERLQDGFESKEEEETFVTNVFTQTEGKEVSLSCNKLGSQCLQRLLLLTSTAPNAILKFSREFSKELFLVCTHHFASHIVESVLKASFRHLQQHLKETEIKKEEENATFSELKSWLLSVGQFFLENLDGLLHNLYSSHVLRSLLQIFGGQNASENFIRSKRSRDYNKRCATTETGEIVKLPNNSVVKIDSTIEIPEEFSLMLKKIGQEFRQKDLPGLCMGDVSAPVLQALLIVLSKNQPKLCQKILKKIIKQAVSVEGKMSSFFTSQTSSYVMEKVLALADEKRKTFIWEKLFQNHLKEIALHPVANYVLQHYHAVIEEGERIEEILNEIGPTFKDIFSASNLGVIVSLGEACKRLKIGQAFFTKSVMSALNCWEPEDRQMQIVPLLLHMVTYEEFIDRQDDYSLDQNSRGVNYHGSLILQHMLWFNKPQKITKSLLSVKLEELRYVVCDSKGSHIIDAFVQSKYVGENIREKLIQLLKSEFVIIACNKHGSRSIDSIWQIATLKQKRMIAEELSKKEHLLGGDLYGRYIKQNLGLTHFKHRLKDWEQAQTANNKKRKLFDDIIGH